MNEDVLWVLKMIFILFCLWFVGGGPARLKQETAANSQPVIKKQNTASVYQPKVYTQTIILK